MDPEAGELTGCPQDEQKRAPGAQVMPHTRQFIGRQLRDACAQYKDESRSGEASITQPASSLGATRSGSGTPSSRPQSNDGWARQRLELQASSGCAVWTISKYFELKGSLRNLHRSSEGADARARSARSLGHVGLAHHGGRPSVRTVGWGNTLAVQGLGDLGEGLAFREQASQDPREVLRTLTGLDVAIQGAAVLMAGDVGDLSGEVPIARGLRGEP